MSERPEDAVGRLLREEYNPPPETPRDEMWAAIEARLEPREGSVRAIEDERRRRARPLRALLAWSVAAAALLVLGVRIGRMTAPVPPPVAEAPRRGSGRAEPGALRVAAVEHLERSETLLRMVRADGAAGRLDPAMGAWARTLLTQTRLFMDTREEADPTVRVLLEDLELVLVQIVGVADTEGSDASRAREELTFALDGIERSDVLPRIQAVVPPGPGMAGT